MHALAVVTYSSRRLPRLRELRQPYPWQQPKRALVAGNDCGLRRGIAHGLREDGFAVVESGWNAALYDYVVSFRHWRPGQLPPRLIVADLDVPPPAHDLVEMTLRQADWQPSLVLVVPRESREDLARWGAKLLFHKPFDVDDLRTAAMYLVDPDAAAAYRNP